VYRPQEGPCCTRARTASWQIVAPCAARRAHASGLICFSTLRSSARFRTLFSAAILSWRLSRWALSPLVSYCGEELETVVKTFDGAYELDLQGFAPQPAQRTNVGPWMLPLAVGYAALAVMKLAKSAK
jgi:hypothetical protein